MAEYSEEEYQEAREIREEIDRRGTCHAIVSELTARRAGLATWFCRRKATLVSPYNLGGKPIRCWQHPVPPPYQAV